MSARRAAFERAVAAYPLGGVEVPDDVAAVAEASLAATGLVLAGEAHGIEQTPRAVHALARRLGIDALAFEWSWDQFDQVVQPVLVTGRIDRDALWSLPADAEAFSGDGRFTAGHVRVLEELAPTLERLVLVDELESGSARAREEHMAARLLDGRRRGGRMLAVTGSWHAALEPSDGVEPAAAILLRALPGLARVMLAPEGGGRHGFDAELPLGAGRPATVPARD